MKATLEFDLPYEKEEHLRATLATNLCAVLWELDSWLREQIKHNEKEHFQEVRDKLSKSMDSNGINLDEIYS